MIKNILIPQDGSAYAKSSLECGIWLARNFGASVEGLYVVDIVSLEGPFLHDISGSLGFEPYLNFSTKMREVLEDRGKNLLEAFAASCDASGVAHSEFKAYGIIAGEICSRGATSDIIIMGKRGVNAMFEYNMLGSTTESVLRKSPKPVLIVPEVFNVPRKPLLAYDGSPSASRAMHSAAVWAKTLRLPLTVVTVSDASERVSVLAGAEAYFKPYDVDVKFVHLSGDGVSKAIEDYYRENGHDLLFMGAFHHSRLVEMVLGSTTEHVMRNVEGPFYLER